MDRWGGGNPDEFVRRFVDDWTGCPIDHATAALLRFADKLTADTASMCRQDVQSLRDAGWDDRAIHDATQIIAYFNYINRVADALGVDPEDGLPEWGGEHSTDCSNM